MPGLTGIISGNNMAVDQWRNVLASMVAALRHYDDYVVRTHAGLGGRVALANISLNIPGASLREYFDPRRRVSVFLGGELINVDELKYEYSLAGGAADTGDSAMVVGRLYEKFRSADFLPLLNGWFSFLILDEDRNVAILANDRWGVQPFYYAHCQNGTFFAPEVKGVTKALSHRLQLDPDSIREYFAFRGILDEKTLFKGVYRLPGASCWTFHASEARWEKKRYWDYNIYSDSPKMDTARALRYANDVFTKLIGRYLKGQYVFSITGGWDTRTIASCWDRHDKPTQCVTYGLSRRTADWVLSDRITQRYGLPHSFFALDHNFLDQFGECAKKTIRLADGMGDIGSSEIVFIHSRFRNSICLTGKYGTQVLADRILPPFLARPDLQTRNVLSSDFCRIDANNVDAAVRAAQQPYAAFTNASDRYLIMALVEECRRYWGDTLAVESTTNLMRSPYLDNDWIDLLFRIPASLRCSRMLQEHIIRANSSRLAGIPTNSGGLPAGGGLIGRIEADLFKVRHWGSIVANSRRVPRWMALDKTFLSNNATKKFGLWLREDLRNWVCDVLFDPRTSSRGIYSPHELRRAVTDHMTKKADNRYSLIKLVSFELFLRELVD